MLVRSGFKEILLGVNVMRNENGVDLKTREQIERTFRSRLERTFRITEEENEKFCEENERTVEELLRQRRSGSEEQNRLRRYT